MRGRDAFGTALQTLRQRLRDGVYVSGAPLVIIELAQELRISPTPVREALARLTGEGLVEERRGWGYGVCRLDRETCEELYSLHLLYVEFALVENRSSGRGKLAQAVQRTSAQTASGLRSATEAVFAAIVEGGCHARGIAAHQSVADHLAPLRLAEAHLFEDGAEELSHLVAALNTDRDADNRDRIAHYHQRRIDAVGTLVRIAISDDLSKGAI